MSFSREFLSEIYRWTQKNRNVQKGRVEIKKQVNVKGAVVARAVKVKVVSAAVKVAKVVRAKVAKVVRVVRVVKALKP
jgi:hypothetical protein